MWDSMFIPVLFLAVLLIIVFLVASRLGYLRRITLRRHDAGAALLALENPVRALRFGVPVCGRPDMLFRESGVKHYVAFDCTDVRLLEEELRVRAPAVYGGVTITGFVYSGRSHKSHPPLFLVFLACEGGACAQETPVYYSSALTHRLAKKYDQRLLESANT